MRREPTRRVKIRAWGIAVLWAAVVWVAGGDSLSAHDTSRFLGPLLDWVLPNLDAADRDLLLGLARKSAHVVEYALLAALLLRALLLSWRRTLVPASLVALCASLGLAVADEWRQGLSAVRTGSAGDVALDLAGALAAIALWALFEASSARRRATQPPSN